MARVVFCCISFLRIIICTLLGMEERVARLEKELEVRIIDKVDETGDHPLYESSSDAGIESGNEVDDCLSEKWFKHWDCYKYAYFCQFSFKSG